MRVLAAPDKFKGTASASSVAEAIAAACRATGCSARALPLADGGEGTLDAFGGPNRTTVVTGPLGVPVSAAWRLDGDLAVIEMAEASGLGRAGGGKSNDPLAATTRGTGELIVAAARAGARRVIVGLGGSATTDGGNGAIEALGARPFEELGIAVDVACDVRTAFLDAARVFGPQKGADARQVEVLTDRLTALADDYRVTFGVDVATMPFTGAAGGLAGGLLALGGRLESGFSLIAALLDLEGAVRAADLVVTGEGRLDESSFAGKVVGGVAETASGWDVPLLVVAGEVDPVVAGRVEARSLSERYGARRAREQTVELIGAVVADYLTDRAP